MRISASGPAGPDLTPRDRNRRDERIAGAAPAQLPAVIEPQARTAEEARPPQRPVAALIAQLVASAQDMPAYRARRRADPAAGAEAYRTVAGFGPAVAPRSGRAI